VGKTLNDPENEALSGLLHQIERVYGKGAIQRLASEKSQRERSPNLREEVLRGKVGVWIGKLLFN